LRVDRRSPRNGRCAPFVDPALGALDAPFCWRADAGSSVLAARARPTARGRADLKVAGLACVRHVVLGPGPVTQLLVRTSDRVLAVEVSGSCALETPIRLTLVVDGLAAAHTAGALIAALPDVLSGDPRWVRRSRRQLQFRNAVMALDGRAHGASYWQIAAIAVGPERARSERASLGRSLKDLMRRALAKGEALRDGAYRQLLG
jgi:hypothetical protein